eukprot:GHVU01040322.1.p1 GENE.GHVU01040322.1~~GHVU01040322.1.p1  ORF type:complete len:112 (+),score=16.73 GHVU01040322.1:89-424(+)
MVYYREFDDFQLAVRRLIAARPNQTRLQVKYRPSDAKLVVKATDNIVCAKFKTDQASALRKIERLLSVAVHWLSKKKILNEESLLFDIHASLDTAEGKAPKARMPKKKRRG